MNILLATVRWTYRNASGYALWSITFTYNLYKYDSEWKILVHTMHDE
jgi:hypothetical protein